MFLIFFIIFVTIVYIYLKSINTYWKNRQVEGPKPKILVGNFIDFVFLRKSVSQIYTDLYNSNQNLPFLGVYQFFSPTLLVRDLDFIKTVTVQEFDHFHDNAVDINEKVDPVFSRNPFSLKGNRWKYIRSLLTPCFTSLKVKNLFPQMMTVGNNLVGYVTGKTKDGTTDGIEVKELSQRFYADVSASCAFGMEGQSFSKTDSPFFTSSINYVPNNFRTCLSIFLSTFFPGLNKFIYLKIVPQKVEDQLADFVSQSLHYRNENGIVAQDFLHSISQLKVSGKASDFTDFDVSSQIIGFLGGMDTTTNTLAYLLFEIASHTDVQNRAREEIKDAIEKNNSELTYSTVSAMDYLDAVIKESLRLHPPGMHSQRRCTKTFTYNYIDPDEGKNMSVTIEKGTTVIIPVYGIHMDSKYYSNPTVFNADRFLKENRDQLNPFTDLSMGQGPRKCLGQKFALILLKVAVAKILQHFEIKVNQKTIVPFQYNITKFILTPEGGVWLDFIPINKNSK